MRESRCDIGAKVRLSRKYFLDIGESAVFTKGNVYDVVGSRQGRGIVHLADIVDDSGVLRHINPDYLERAEFSRGSVVKIKHEILFCGRISFDFVDLEKPREIIGVSSWGYATIEDDHGYRRDVYFGLLEMAESEVAV